jgi:hypothetical protein
MGLSPQFYVKNIYKVIDVNEKVWYHKDSSKSMALRGDRLRLR